VAERDQLLVGVVEIEQPVDTLHNELRWSTANERAGR
jgi:hypothetical protein